ncbi:MAG: DNA cytosine methyltransferase [Magnetococcales bacterium]|nr:DNA cytosine methyltransferase [Magnetococcales bacterium]
MRAVQLALFDPDQLEPKENGPFKDLCRILGVDHGPNWHDRFGLALSAWAKLTIKSPIRTLSLFSGAGGLDIGFHDAGFQIECAVEIDERFAATLKANARQGGYLAGTEVLCQDIRDFHPDPNQTIDFLLGGPPCQSFSAAGRRAAGVQGTQDERGTLFQEYVRLLKLLKPRAFLFENVYGITGAEQGIAWQSIKQAFEDAGYRLAFRILDTADYGVPQHRERMFIVGTRDRYFSFPAPTHGPDSPDRTPHIGASETTEGALVTSEERQVRVGGRFGYLLEQIPEGLNYSFFTEKMGHPQPIFAWRSKFSDFLYKADPNVPVRTIKAQGGQYTGPFHWESRPFTVAEMKRLQTFPDQYMIVGGRQVAIHQIGNSVPPQAARVLALAILEQVFGVMPPSPLPVLRDGEGLSFRKRKRGLTSVYRDKASIALNGQKAREQTTDDTITKHGKARIGQDFIWQSCEDGPLYVQSIAAADKWIVRVDISEPKPFSADSAFEITLTSQNSWEWALGKRTVKLIGGSLERDVFVGVWKAFEAELDRLNVKADLVQLCEYYQYRPRFTCKMTIHREIAFLWNVLKNVIEGIGIRSILTGREIANLWGCHEKDVFDSMLWLRSLAYEARNNSTNPQIPRGSYLIPYAFPTLNQLSVQVRKSMVNVDE